MKSSDLKSHGFTKWIPFSLEEKDRVLSALPREKGTYVIRKLTEFGRLMGSSDIIYIGSAINNDGIRSRVRHYFHPGPTQLTSQRINSLFSRILDLEISWVTETPTNLARGLETQLLEIYKGDHIELPPLNRRD